MSTYLSITLLRPIDGLIGQEGAAEEREFAEAVTQGDLQDVLRTRCGGPVALGLVLHILDDAVGIGIDNATRSRLEPLVAGIVTTWGVAWGECTTLLGYLHLIISGYQLDVWNTWLESALSYAKCIVQEMELAACGAGECACPVLI